jgi:hypothetical protein
VYRCNSENYVLMTPLQNWDSAVGIATGYGLDGRGVGIRVLLGARIFSYTRRPDQLWGPPSLLSLGVKREGRKADHLPPTSANVKNT